MFIQRSLPAGLMYKTRIIHIPSMVLLFSDKYLYNDWVYYSTIIIGLVFVYYRYNLTFKLCKMHLFAWMKETSARIEPGEQNDCLNTWPWCKDLLTCLASVADFHNKGPVMCYHVYVMCYHVGGAGHTVIKIYRLARSCCSISDLFSSILYNTI